MLKRIIQSYAWTHLVLAITICVTLTSMTRADVEAVRGFLANSSQTAYLVNGNNDIRLVDTLRDRTVNNVYQKTINGIPLHGGFIKVIHDREGISTIVDRSTENLQFLPTVPTVNSEQAIHIVDGAMGELKSDGSTTELVWFRIGNSAKLAWEVTTQLAETGAAVSPTALLSVVDSNNGELLSQSQFDSNTYEPEGLNNNQGIFPRIVINNSIGPTGSRNYAASFDGVVSLAFGCTGVLIADNVVLSARHCGAFAGDQIQFGANSNSPAFIATVQSSFLPDGSGSLLDGGDIAILTLNTSVPSSVAQPMRLIDETNGLVGMLCATLGYGYNGVGSQGHGFTADGRRWGGENVIDRYGSPASASGSNIISTDFDNGSNGANTIGGSSSTPVQFEATTAPGDSGGPVLVQSNSGEWLIAGVLSGGTTSNSVYGDISWWTGTADFRNAIENRGGEFADPNSGSLLGDVNQDGVVNLLDVGPFVDRVGSGAYQVEADMNEDGAVNLLDVSLFIDALSG